MDKVIEKALEREDFGTENEIKAFVKEMQAKITAYEKRLYEKDRIDETHLLRIQDYRRKLLKIAKTNRKFPVIEDPEEKEGFETLRLLNKQIDIADTNQGILSKSTLKILSLDYSSKELEQAIFETSKKLEKSVNMEKTDEKRLFMIFFVFLCTCLAILFDKFYQKMK